MFYRRNIIDGKVGVVDTQDGVCEYYTEDELNKFGVDILPNLPADFYPSLEHRMSKKLYYMATRGEASTFFSNYCLPSIDSKSIILELIKCWDYNETHGLMVFAIRVKNGVAILVVREDGYNWSAILAGSWRFSYYPIGSGRLFNILFKRVMNIDTALDENLLYILCYKDNKANLIRIRDLAIKEICEVKEDLK